MYGLPMLSVVRPASIEGLDGFQNMDDSGDWRDHEPEFAWTDEDLAEFEHDRRVAENERLAMAAWWEMEGVRCGTFGPPRNPYLTAPF